MIKINVILKNKSWKKYLKNPINLSGNVFFHFTPNNISTWESTEFTEFNSPDLDFGSVVIQVKK